MTPAERYCFFRRCGAPGECMARADGQPDRAHLLPQQRIRAAGQRRGWPPSKIAAATWDPRVFVLSCRRHHGNTDLKFFRLREDQYPESFRAWAKEFGFFWASERDGWLATADDPQEAA